MLKLDDCYLILFPRKLNIYQQSKEDCYGLTKAHLQGQLSESETYMCIIFGH